VEVHIGAPSGTHRVPLSPVGSSDNPRSGHFRPVASRVDEMLPFAARREPPRVRNASLPHDGTDAENTGGTARGPLGTIENMAPRLDDLSRSCPWRRDDRGGPTAHLGGLGKRMGGAPAVEVGVTAAGTSAAARAVHEL
jgi:hypothetical protein